MRNAIKKFFVPVACVTIAACFAGCAFVSHGRMSRITPTQVDTIKIGTTTVDDILKLLGNPQRVVRKTNGIEVFIYTHGVERSLTIPFLISWTRGAGTGQTLNVIFQNNVVIDYEYVTDERGMIQ